MQRLLGCIYTGPDHIPTQLGRGMQGSSAAFTQGEYKGSLAAFTQPDPIREGIAKAPWLHLHIPTQVGFRTPGFRP